MGKTYIPFPDARTHRILLEDLLHPKVRQRLRQVWVDPMALDPSRYSAKVTEMVAGRLALLARSLEGEGHSPEIEMAEVISKTKRSQWPATLSDQVRAIRAALEETQGTIGADLLARQFTRARASRVEEILKTLVSLGQAREVEGRYVI
ncbi:MAG: hypothetical protein WA510_03755 [Acidobacteriaceae bacterium]